MKVLRTKNRAMVYLLTPFIMMFLMLTASAETQYSGVNLAGADFGYDVLPGEFGTQYTYPINEEVDYFTSKGMNIFRLPFLWERLQNDQSGPLNADELNRIKEFVAYANSKQASVILDPHNSARYYGEIIGIDGDLGALPLAAFEDFWTKLANEFKDNDKVIFGLMNEPHDMPSELWRDDANAAIVAIRATGAKNLILVPGNAWTGAHSWLDDSYGTPNGTVMKDIVDSENRIAFEVHQYFDTDSSGTSANCISATVGSERLVDFTNWLRENNQQGFLGEFAGGNNSTCLNALDNMLDYVDANNDVWMGWTYWAAGPWWGEDIFTVEPKDGVDRPQMAILSKHLSSQSGSDSEGSDQDGDQSNDQGGAQDDEGSSSSSGGGSFSGGVLFILLGLSLLTILKNRFFKHKSTHPLFLAFLILSSSVGVVNAAEYTVAKDGSDANSGSVESPFLTISHCAQVAQAGDTCQVRGGIYRETITPAHSGNSGNPITFKAYSGDHVLVSGADVVSNFSALGNGRYRATVSTNLGLGKNQIFADGKMLWEARFPNANADVMSAMSGKVSNPSKSGDTWSFDVAGLPANVEQAQINILPGPEWVAETGLVLSSDAGRLRFQALYGQLKDTYYDLREGNPYVIWGHGVLLDDAGEFFQNGNTLEIMLDPSNHFIEAKSRDFAFVLDNLSHIVIDGFDIFAATITTGNPNPSESNLSTYPNVSSSSNITLNNLNFRYVSHFTHIRPGTAASGPGVYEAWSKGTTDSGVMLFGDSHSLKNSTIAFSAGNGIALAGTNHLIENVIVHDVDYSVTDGAALLAGFYDINSSGHTVRNSSFSRSARSILTHRGVQNLKVLNNDLFDAGLVAHDLGITYTYQTDGAGTVIAGNKVHGNPRNGDFIGIYLDNDSSGMSVHHNIVWDVTHAFQMNMPARANSPMDNIIVNNTFVGNETSVRSWGANLTYYDQDFSQLILQNNILIGPRSTYTSSEVIANPLFNESYNLEGLSSADLQFVDLVSNNFRLAVGSPAIDAGQVVSGITEEFNGAAPDVGAVEGRSTFLAGANRAEPCVYGDDCAPSYAENSEPSIIVNTVLNNTGFESPYNALAECDYISGEIAQEWYDNTCWESSANIYYSEDNNNPHSGSSSQRVESQGGLAQLVQLLKLESNKHYNASVWMRSESPMDVSLILRQTGEPYTIHLEQTFTLSNQWKKYSLEGDLGEIPSESFLMILSEQNGVFWVDDASLSNNSSSEDDRNISSDGDTGEDSNSISSNNDDVNSGGGSLSARLLMVLLLMTQLIRRSTKTSKKGDVCFDLGLS